jgi:hypothetical protein
MEDAKVMRSSKRRENGGADLKHICPVQRAFSLEALSERAARKEFERQVRITVVGRPHRVDGDDVRVTT